MSDPKEMIIDAEIFTSVPEAKRIELQVVKSEYGSTLAPRKSKYEADLRALNVAYYADIDPLVRDCTAKLEAIRRKYARRIWRTDE